MVPSGHSAAETAIGNRTHVCHAAARHRAVYHGAGGSTDEHADADDAARAHPGTTQGAHGWTGIVDDQGGGAGVLELLCCTYDGQHARNRQKNRVRSMDTPCHKSLRRQRLAHPLRSETPGWLSWSAASGSGLVPFPAESACILRPLTSGSGCAVARAIGSSTVLGGIRN